MGRLDELKAADARVTEAEQEYTEVLRRTFPVGSVQTYTRGKHKISGEVLRHRDTRVFVEGYSGQRYWVCGSRFL